MPDLNVIEPTITVQDVDNIVVRGGGMAGVVLFVGSFGAIGDNTIKSYTNPRIAIQELAGDLNEVPEEAEGFHCLQELFGREGNSLGVEELLIVNTTTDNSGTPDYTLTNNKFADALELIKDEEFDIFALGGILDEAKARNLKKLRDDMYKIQLPWGVICAVEIEEKEDINVMSKIWETGGAYKLVTTRKQKEGSSEPLTLVQTAAWEAAYTAGRMVNDAETGKRIPGVSGLGTKEEFPDLYEDILKKGLHSQRIWNRRLNEIRVNNIMTPRGFDMILDRIRDFVVGDLALRDIFGDPNRKVTYDFVEGMFEVKKLQYLSMRILADMKYEILECNPKCVQAELELIIPDVIVDVRLNVKVTPYSVEVSL